MLGKYSLTSYCIPLCLLAVMAPRNVFSQCCSSFVSARTMEEMYRHLSIDVEDENGPPADGPDENLPPWSVQRGLDQFFAPEKREIRCEKCEDGTTATQTLRVLSRYGFCVACCLSALCDPNSHSSLVFSYELKPKGPLAASEEICPRGEAESCETC